MASIRLKANKYSDAAYVEGVYRREPVMERAFYQMCKHYFDENYRGVFFVGNDKKEEIFQEAFITLWENILNKRLYVENGELLGKDGKPFSGRITTYLMSIARIKYLEWSRKYKGESQVDIESLNGVTSDGGFFEGILYDEADGVELEIIAECISHMSERCNQILTMFYYEEKTLDDIMVELPSFESKNALKTAKYKCMENLRKSANDIYRRYLRS